MTTEKMHICTEDAAIPTRCPWCGEVGLEFDESPAPSEYCGHDPALIRQQEEETT